MKTSAVIILSVVAVGSSLLMNALFDFSSKMTLEQHVAAGYQGGEGRVATAVQLLRHGTFTDENRLFLGAVPRGPVYPIFIAGAFLFLGSNMLSLWIFQMITFVGAVLLLYAISLRLMPHPWAVAPPMLFASFWAAALNVFRVNNEILSFAIIFGFLLLLFYYYESNHAAKYLAGAATLFSLLILLKPTFEYMVPLIFIILIWHWHAWGFNGRRRIRHATVFIIIFTFIVGGWHVRNDLVWGTPRLSGGGHALLIHAQSLLYEGDAFRGFYIASFAGDFIADKLVPGYADHPEPATYMRSLGPHIIAAAGEGGSDAFLYDDKALEDAIRIVLAHPLTFIGVIPAWFLQLNSIPSQFGGSIAHLFVETHEEISDGMKVAIIASLRSIWYAMVFTVFICMFGHVKRFLREPPQALVWILLLVIFTNVMYSFLTHALVRYVLPVIPLYFLLITMVVHRRYMLYRQVHSRDI